MFSLINPIRIIAKNPRKALFSKYPSLGSSSITEYSGSGGSFANGLPLAHNMCSGLFLDGIA
jgi:hypothetical protein